MADNPADRAFWNRVLKSIARHARGNVDPEELLNIAFIRLENYRAGHVVEDPRAFLVRTAKNVLIDNYRHNQVLVRHATDMAQGGQDASPLQDEVFAARARLNRVKLGLAQLPARTREIFLMHRLDELKYREIAQRMDISESAVEKHIAKAMLFLTKWTEGW